MYKELWRSVVGICRLGKKAGHGWAARADTAFDRARVVGTGEKRQMRVELRARDLIFYTRRDTEMAATRDR